MKEEIGSVVMDVVQTKENLMIITPMAWTKLEDVDITLNKMVLTISWERKKPDFYDDGNTEIKFNEVYFGQFLRNVILPENLDLDEIKAYMEDNMLVITIPRLKYDSKTIKINRIES
jgi:HSP20 family protein